MKLLAFNYTTAKMLQSKFIYVFEHQSFREEGSRVKDIQLLTQP